jgi:hypothetical protein
MPVVLAAVRAGMGQWAWPRIAAVHVIVVTTGIIAFAFAQRLFFQGPYGRRAEGLTRADLARCHPRGRGEKVGVMGRCHRRTASAGAALLIAAGAGGAAAAEQSFSLVISGDEGARYTGRCTLTTTAGESGPSKSGPRRSPPAETLPGAPRPSLPHHLTEQSGVAH